jgi:HEAT repeat protein
MSVTAETVKQLLDSTDLGDRLRGVNQLRQLPPEIAFKLIQPAATDSNSRVRYAAISQFASLGHQNLATAAEVLQNRLLHDSEVDVQAAAADSIAALKLTELYDHLQTLYHSSSEWLLKFSIVAALGELGEPRAFDLLADALNSENELLKTGAIGSLGELGDRRAVPLLVPHATDHDWQVRYRVAQALGRLGDSAALTTLQTLATDPVQQVAQEASTHLNHAKFSE